MENSGSKARAFIPKIEQDTELGSVELFGGVDRFAVQDADNSEPGGVLFFPYEIGWFCFRVFLRKKYDKKLTFRFVASKSCWRDVRKSKLADCTIIKLDSTPLSIVDFVMESPLSPIIRRCCTYLQ